jgi:NADH-quinone oxidoreductase subunit M
MPETDVIWMSLVIFTPTVFALLLVFFPRGAERAMCWFSLAGTALTLGISIGMFILFKTDTIDRVGVPTNNPEARVMASLDWRAEQADRDETAARKSDDWVARYPWISRFGIDYYLGVDGISMPLVLLTTLLSFLAMIASFHVKRYEGGDRFVRGYCILFLLLETGMVGTFLALDFFLFFIFWEVMLLPMYFLIGIWGGPRREYAAIKFFLYTMLGSVFILIALLAFYFTDVRDFVDPRVRNAEVARSDDPGVRQAREAREQATVRVRNAEARLEQLREMDSARAGKLLDGAGRTYQGAKARLRRAEADLEKAKAGLPVNSFDLVALARAGRAAREHLNGGSVGEVPALSAAQAEAEKARKELEEARKQAEASKAQGNKKVPAQVEQLIKEEEVKDAEARVARAERGMKLTQEGLDGRLKQAFFTPGFQYTMFLLLIVGFAIKIPVFPFHTWLPDAHVEAPTPISMILAGVLLKMGGYGFLRIAYPICPWAAEHLATWVATFGVINIVYGAFAAMAQTDFKKLVAYSSISHMGYVVLGIAVWASPANRQYWAWGVNGAMYQMLAHGISSAGMFFLVGVIYDRAHHRNLDNFRGLYEPMPLYAGLSAVIFFAAMGLPGLCGFPGEFMVVLSTWGFAPGGQLWVGRLFATLAALTVVLTASYILWTLQRVFMGTNPVYKGYKDITLGELAAIVPLVVLAVVLGVFPALVLSWVEPSLTHLVDTLARVGP